MKTDDSAIRSLAIREFCQSAGIRGSVEAKHIPDDVRAYRMASAHKELISSRKGVPPAEEG